MNKIELWEFVDKKSKEHLDFENEKLPEYLEMVGKDIPEEKRADVAPHLMMAINQTMLRNALGKTLVDVIEKMGFLEE
ncbi:hypothetical protein [uncultured Enterococcus sp.]|uniref:hypothetical protein n=1 Tax=uncultured Enterococcus sp. TaxID=167972 RepID=UPI00259916FC|nr:hypothetical protein [uncultured Enterococcus sp.]